MLPLISRGHSTLESSNANHTYTQARTQLNKYIYREKGLVTKNIHVANIAIRVVEKEKCNVYCSCRLWTLFIMLLLVLWLLLFITNTLEILVFHFIYSCFIMLLLLFFVY